MITLPWAVAVVAGSMFLWIGLLAGGRAETHWNSGEPAPRSVVRMTVIGLGGFALMFVVAALITIAGH